MVPGSNRYERRIGYVGETAAESQRNAIERITGLDFTGSLRPSGGSGWTVGAAPSTILLGIMGTVIGANMWRNKSGNMTLTGAMLGFGVGAAISTLTKFAANVGF